MRILLMRHGQSEADILNVHEGSADFSLTNLGHLQAMETSKWLARNYSVDMIFSSTLKRAVQTAEYLSDATGTDIILLDKLREYDNGLLAGLSFEEAEKRYPKAPRKAINRASYEMESALDFRYRAHSALADILFDAQGCETVVAISHGGMINAIIQCFLRLPIDTDTRFLTGDTGVHSIILKGVDRYIEYFNYLQR